MNAIEFLMTNADKFDYDIIDESELHNRVQIVFQNKTRVFCGTYDISPIQSIIYNTELKEIELCIEDDYGIASIYDLNDIHQIFDKNTLFYENSEKYGGNQNE